MKVRPFGVLSDDILFNKRIHSRNSQKLKSKQMGDCWQR